MKSLGKRRKRGSEGEKRIIQKRKRVSDRRWIGGKLGIYMRGRKGRGKKGRKRSESEKGRLEGTKKMEKVEGGERKEGTETRRRKDTIGGKDKGKENKGERK